MLRTLKRLLRIYQVKPYIIIGEYGQLTATNHNYSVGFASRTGVCGALNFPADELGFISATSYAKTYSHITGLPIVDNRMQRY